MKKIKFSVLFIFIITALLLLSSCEESGSSSDDGTITVQLTNYNSTLDTTLYVYVYRGGETDVNTASKVLGFKTGDISGGSATVIVKNAEPGGDFVTEASAQWTGSGGESYDIYIYTDDSSNDPTDNNSGEKKADSYPMSVTVDGDHVISLDYVNNMVSYN